MYYDIAIRSTIQFAINILETIVPSSPERLNAIQKKIEETLLNSAFDKSQQDQIDRIGKLHDELNAFNDHIETEIKPEAQTLVEDGIIAEVMSEIFLWQKVAAEWQKTLKDELEELALAN